MWVNNSPFFTASLLFLGLIRLSSIPGLEAQNQNGGPMLQNGAPAMQNGAPAMQNGAPAMQNGAPAMQNGAPAMQNGAPAQVPGIYVFGDSLVDAGNNNYLAISISKANYPHNGIDFPQGKPTGRFSNGKNAADVLAEKFGLPLPPPYLSLIKPRDVIPNNLAVISGVNFASGGAGIFNSTDNTRQQAIPLSFQINHWLEIQGELVRQLGQQQAIFHLSKSLFTIVIGSNDLFDYSGSLTLRRKTNPQQYTQSMVDKLKEQIQRILQTGARKFLVVGVAQIGCIPGYREKKTSAHKCNEEANTWCVTYNDALMKMLQQLQQESQNTLSFCYFDNFKSMQDMLFNPVSYGFSDVISACCGSGKLNSDIHCIRTARYCPDRTKFLFWDKFGHPTEAAARTFVDLMFLQNSPYTFPQTLTQLVSS